jgi:type IV pilus assembly protein PilQ
MGMSLIALGAHAATIPLDDEARESGKSSLAEIEKDIVALPAQSVTNIEVHPEGERVTVAIVGDGTFFPDAKLLDESRLVIDMPAVSSAFRQSLVQGHHPLLKTVRVGHHADKVRLVFDLLEQPAFSVETKGNKVLVVLSPKELHGSPGEVSKPANPIEVSRPALQEHKVLFDSGPRGVKRIARIIGPAQSPFKVQPVQMAAESASDQKDNRSDDLVAGQTQFIGRRISLDFQQADITNILRLIADVSGFNIVVGEGVKSKVTMKLVNVPWDQALDMLLKMNGLGMIRQGSIVWVDSLSNLSKQQDEEARAKESKVKAEDLVDRVFYIKNIQAQELMTSLRQYLSPRGVMQFNAGSNALIVRETESKLVVIRQLVEGLDLEVPQVQIEARIVQADTVYARGLGIQWGFQAAHKNASDFNAIGGLNGPFGELAGTGNSTIS